jgi:hypothetical protein
MYFSKKIIGLGLSFVFLFSGVCLSANAEEKIVANGANVLISDVKHEENQNSKLDYKTIDDLCYVPYDKISVNFREPIDKAFNELNLGSNSEYMNVNGKILEKKIKSEGCHFFDVDLGNDESMKKLEEDLKKLEEDEKQCGSKLKIFFIDHLNCSDYGKYESCKKKLSGKFGVFVENINMCGKSDCKNCYRMFKNFKVLKFDRGPSVLDGDEVVRYLVEQCSNYLNVKVNVSDEQVRLISELVNYSCLKLEKIFKNIMIEVDHGKKFDFNLILREFLLFDEGIKGKYFVDPKEMKDTLIHEFCHAVVGWYLEDSPFVIMTFRNAEGVNYFYDCKNDKSKQYDNVFLTYEKICNFITSALAGRAGEIYFYNKYSSGAMHDLGVVKILAERAVVLKNPWLCYKSDADRKDACLNLISSLEQKATEIIERNRILIEKLADYFMKKEEKYGIRYMLGSEFKNICDNVEEFFKKVDEDADKKIAELDISSVVKVDR